MKPVSETVERFKSTYGKLAHSVAFELYYNLSDLAAMYSEDELPERIKFRVKYWHDVADEIYKNR